MIHPEFPERITWKVWKAAFRRLYIPRFRSYFTGGLSLEEVEDVFLATSFTPPALAVTLGAIDDTPLASQHSDQTTVIGMVIIWPAPLRPRDVQDGLRPRILDDIRATLKEDYGRLRDQDGSLLTESLTRFQRLQPVEAVPRIKPQYLRDRLQVAYKSHVLADLTFEG